MPPRLPSNFTAPLASSGKYCARASSSVASSSHAPPASILRKRRLFSSLTSSSHNPRLYPPSPPSSASRTCSGTRAFHASAVSKLNKDPYSVLGVSKSASAADIKKKYYDLARKHHPDTNKDPTAKDRFVEIQAAWDILGDEKKRAEYDQYGAASQQQGFDPNFAGGRGSAGGFGFGGFGGFGSAFTSGRGASGADLFESLFGGGSARPRDQGPQRGDDLQASVTIQFVDACKGVTRHVHVSPIVDCKVCDGSGLKKGQQRKTCASCHGTGTQVFVIESGFQMAGTCTTCQGTGSVTPKGAECNSCDGMGKVKERKTVSVEIPAGVDTGNVVRVAGAGDKPISGRGPAGDLLVQINVASSKVFRRQGVHLYHDAKIPLTTALLGGKVRVPTLDGDVDVRVPSGTQPGQEAVLQGRGVPNFRNKSVGDLFVTFGVQLPRSLTTRQRAILQQFADDLDGKKPEDKASPPPPTPSSNPPDSPEFGGESNSQPSSPSPTSTNESDAAAMNAKDGESNEGAEDPDLDKPSEATKGRRPRAAAASG